MRDLRGSGGADPSVLTGVVVQYNNYNPLLRDRIDTCIAEWGRLPTLIGVDFYSIGNILTVVENLNLGR